MKIKMSLAALLLSALVISSCKKNNDSSANNSAVVTMATLTSGSWRVSYLHEGNDDHTPDFNGYTFVFSANGTVTATNPGGNVNGTWKIDDSNTNEVKLDLGKSDPLKRLSHGWLVVSGTPAEIIFRDDDSSHSEELHFAKI